MLRINLLPPYIFDKQKKIRLAIVWGVAAAAVVALIIMKSVQVSGDLDVAKKQLDEATALKTEWDGYETQINGVNTKVAETKSKETFIANAKKSNDAWPAVYEAMRDVTSPVILLQSLSVEAANHKALDFTGFAKDELTIARWWMTLRNAKNTFDSVSFNLPSHPYVPAGAQGGQGGFGMQGRMSGGMQGMGMAGMGSGMPGGGGFGGGAGGTSSLAQKFANMGRPGGGGGGGFGGGGNRSANVGPTEIEGRPGLGFTGVALVKDTLAPPAAPAWPAGGGGGGGGMGMPGMPGGMPGMGAGGRMGGAGMSPGSMPGGGGAPPPAASGGGGGKKGSKDAGDE